MELLTVLRLQLDLLLDSAHAVKLEIDPHKHTWNYMKSMQIQW